MPTALLLSPHLDDVIFSCGGVAAALAEAGWRVMIATVFTRSVMSPTGFALACQLDKGLAADIDYMALRRSEDAAACVRIGAEPLWMDLPEAPHRGYRSAQDLFGEFVAADTVAADVTAHLDAVWRRLHPDLVLAPQGLGRHVDHRRVHDAVLCRTDADVGWYCDTPYVIREPAARPSNPLLALHEAAIDIHVTLEPKLDAAASYVSQNGFQFGGNAAMRAALRALAYREGGGCAAERIRGSPALHRRLNQALDHVGIRA